MELLIGILRETAWVTRQRCKSILSSAAHPLSTVWLKGQESITKTFKKLSAGMHS